MSNKDGYTKKVMAALQVLWDADFAVIAWSPTQLKGVKPHRVEEAAGEAGAAVIEALAIEPDEDDEA